MGGELIAAEPAYETDIRLMLRCGRSLAGCLRADSSTREAPFDAEAIRELTRFYREAPASAYYNRILTTAVDRGLAASPHDGPVRMLEIGVVTGGCTKPLPAPPPGHDVTYTLTAASARFV